MRWEAQRTRDRQRLAEETPHSTEARRVHDALQHHDLRELRRNIHFEDQANLRVSDILDTPSSEQLHFFKQFQMLPSLCSMKQVACGDL
eukprot:52178-Rhodomonas_salina.1